MIIDCFAGGGGASTGIELALGRSPDVAINHSAQALAMHAANHPRTTHLQTDIWDVSPRKVTQGRPVELAWFSPDCRHFSKAKGGAPVSTQVRSLAWVVVRWARDVRPAVLMLENVAEFATWGPLLDNGKPCPLRKGWTFRRWWRELESLGYTLDARELRACDYGAPTSRKRLFIIARRDGQPIVWPEPTHGPGTGRPWRTAAEIIDWSIPCPSIFSRARPLADATMKRIAAGVMRYVVNAREPFVVPGPISPFITEHANASNQRNMPADEPLRTVCAGVKGGHFALVSAFLAKHYTGVVGQDLRKPLGTVTAVDHHSLVSAFLVAYYGNDKDGRDLRDPMGTVVTKDRFGLVTVHGEPYRIVDIGMRMLAPRELFNAQGFPDDYIIDRGADGKALSKTDQVRLCGNSVSPPIAAAIVASNINQKQREAA